MKAAPLWACQRRRERGPGELVSAVGRPTRRHPEKCPALGDESFAIEPDRYPSKRSFEPIGFARLARSLRRDPAYHARAAGAPPFNGALPGVEPLLGWLPNDRARYFSEDGQYGHAHDAHPIR